MTDTTVLARLEPVSVRAIRADEAQDFTPSRPVPDRPGA